MEELRFELTQAVQYSPKGSGEMVSGSFILLTGPTYKQSRECARLKQMFFRALPKDQKSEETTTEEKEQIDIKAADVIVLISQSKNAELPEFLEVSKKLLTEVGQMEGETKLSPFMIDKMTYDDFETLAGTYVANFILASSLAAMNEKRSKESQT